ncbi:hypothetical protein ACFW9F_10000 [Streptomyces sp. NPDC059506]|uniref:Uncharacterized protein n=1 Tax=Streptomyces thermolineatus TaxID=44033 RepID=A0ABN3LYF3_9ACTN|nr:hypothetical protein [Streptomyces sp. SCUT-3]PLW65964.1 hypothetical protein C0036_25310 [Streptomyces sp. DJ]QMV21520.1 hypothetical protein GQS52_06735 [Streptomyces sp. SCUT-3]
MSAPTFRTSVPQQSGGGGYGYAGPAQGRPPYAAGPAGAGPEQQRRRLRPAFGLLGPRRDRHVLPSEQLAALSLPVGDDGVVIGVDTHNQPAVLGLSRPTRLDVLLVGGMWLAQVVALRAAATGARVAVETGRPQAWTPMAQAAGGGQQCVTVHQVGRVSPQGPSVASPVLIVRDCGIRPPRGRVASAPWQSVLTLLPYLGPTAPRLLSNADLVGVQRVSPQEAEVIGRIMGLPRAEVSALSTLGDNVTLWCTRKHRQFVMTQPTDAETGLLGAARRVD